MRRTLKYQTEFHYIGLGNDFWSCFSCRTQNLSVDVHCWICKKPKEEASQLPDTLICLQRKNMEYNKEVKQVAFDLEQDVRLALNIKYTYMLSAEPWELDTLAKLVDIRYSDEPKYSELSIKQAFKWAEQIIEQRD